MNRRKQNIKITDYLAMSLQIFANSNADIEEINNMTNYPEISELIESQSNVANRICQCLCKELNIVGYKDKQLLKNEEEYYDQNGLLKENYVKRYSK